MKKLFKFIIPVVAIAFLMGACEYETIEPEQIDPDTKVSFENDIIPVFDANCNSSGCHGAGEFDPVLTPENAYDNLFAGDYIDTVNPQNSPLYESITSGSMEEYTAPGDAEIILLWIEQGAKNN
ncbi:MAG: hypothetical protein K9I68_05725 [Bacteroidales bacterium]|nr:hypothetical protein [Bacteroidales bacterium]MCF8338266.1 hypothetical protein [Bacteroidales bacterium]